MKKFLLTLFLLLSFVTTVQAEDWIEISKDSIFLDADSMARVGETTVQVIAKFPNTHNRFNNTNMAYGKELIQVDLRTRKARTVEHCEYSTTGRITDSWTDYEMEWLTPSDHTCYNTILEFFLYALNNGGK